jgi:type IV fimbrial biogenesis protein FimT
MGSSRSERGRAVDFGAMEARSISLYPAEMAMTPRTESGVTLVELLTVITILGILMAIGVPSYRSVTNANRVAAEINGLLSDMQTARSEAVKEGQDVSICASSDGKTCSGSNSWDAGWIVILDPTGDLSGQTVIRTQQAFANGDQLKSTATQSLTFGREGFPTNFAALDTFVLKDRELNNARTRCLQVTVVGMMTASTYDGNNCK